MVRNRAIPLSESLDAEHLRIYSQISANLCSQSRFLACLWATLTNTRAGDSGIRLADVLSSPETLSSTRKRFLATPGLQLSPYSPFLLLLLQNRREISSLCRILTIFWSRRELLSAFQLTLQLQLVVLPLLRLLFLISHLHLMILSLPKLIHLQLSKLSLLNAFLVL
jgi:hypothetical protein